MLRADLIRLYNKYHDDLGYCPVYANASYVAYNVGRLGKGSFEGFKSNPRNAAMIAAVDDDAALWEMYTIGRNEYKAE